MRELILRAMYGIDIGSARELYQRLTAAQRAKHDEEAFVDCFNRMVTRRLIKFYEPDDLRGSGYFLSVAGIEAHQRLL